MPEPTESPGAAPDVARQIAQLTDAVNRREHPQQRSDRAPNELPHVSGDHPGDHATNAAIDVAKPSPLHQITLGLRHDKPVASARAMVAHAPGADAPEGGAETPHGAE